MKKTCKDCGHRRNREHGFETVDTKGTPVFICWFCYSKSTYSTPIENHKPKVSKEVKFHLMIALILAVGGFFAWLMTHGK